MRIILAALLIWHANLAQADTPDPPLPALYRVVDVAADDVLNIRVATDAGAPIISALGPTDRGIEVVALSQAGRWAKINIEETAGWVAFRYLQAEPELRTDLGLPPGLQCFGTEPFWAMTFGGVPFVTYITPEGDSVHDVTAIPPPDALQSFTQTGFRFAWDDAGTDVTAHVLPGQCSDGMSDRSYGLHYIDDRGPRVGCCSLE